MATNVPVTGDTPITIKLTVNEDLNKKLKLPLKDLNAELLLPKLRQILSISPDTEVSFERFSDSSGGYVTLDPNNPAVFKTLARAAKAKLKLRLRATVKMDKEQEKVALEQAHKLAAQLPEVPRNPIIARSPPIASIREPTSIDRQSIGSGIFDFKDSRPSIVPQATEAPLPSPFGIPVPETFEKPNSLAFRAKALVEAAKAIPTWSVYCNECDTPMANEHYHCSICDAGDYDLCEACVAGGKLCPGEGHWLIKRSVKDGQVVTSTTERLAPRSQKPNSQTLADPTAAANKDVPGAFSDDTKTLNEDPSPSRTCNSCVNIQPEDQFVTCTVCADYDLCLNCHSDNKHGHHPAHPFKSAVSGADLTLMQEALLPAGRNTRHHAVCDGCNKNIYGVRHKCFHCPDFDYCDECIKSARTTHPLHRFAQVFEQIPMTHRHKVMHSGIYCDGPTCSAKSRQNFIQGVRYKCVICHDTDFCEDCEALPGSFHNKTHPLIKIRQPIRGLNVSTVNETPSGKVQAGLGDHKRVSKVEPRASFPAPVPVVAASPSTVSLKTVADFRPSAAIQAAQASPNLPVVSAATTSSLSAHFVRDAIPDGMKLDAGSRFTQVWTLRNPGPETWPAGCSIRYIGGDNMLNIDNNHASSASDVAEATESNVVGREVLPGEEVAFAVTMKAPVRAGKAISYWRLKAADGTPFGHRLWCDISVQDARDDSILKLPSAVSLQGPVFPQTTSDAARGYPRPALSFQEMQERQHAALRQQQAAMMERAAKATSSQAPTIPSAQSYYAQHQERMRAMQEVQRERIQQAKARYHAQQSQQASLRQLRRDLAEFSSNSGHAKNNQTLGNTLITPQEATRQAFAEQEFVQSNKPASAEANAAASASNEKKTESSANATSEAKTGNMVFPTLEKESPASSTYQSLESSIGSKGKPASVEDEATGAKTSAVITQAAPSETSVAPSESDESVATQEGYEDVADDIEVLSANSEMSEDDGFLTDEEYDILDASDQETVASFK